METARPVPLFSQPLMNAAGSLGFVPDLHAGLPWDSFGAFVTNPISYRPRHPARGERMRGTPGGILLHTGHFNPGFSKALKRFGRRWAQAPVPVLVHLLASAPAEMHKMIVRLEAVENVIGVEVGFPADVTQDDAEAVLSGAVGELSVMARVSLLRASGLAPALLRAGASAVTLGPPRGALPAGQGEHFSGRLFGPAVFSQLLYVTRELARQGVPVIAGSGVYTPGDVEALLDAGALAVQVDTVLWRGDWPG